jgi:hypothetical protein
MNYFIDDTYEEEPPIDRTPPIVPVGRTVQDVIDALQKVEDKKAILTIKVRGHDRELFAPYTIQDSPLYSTGARTFLQVN